MQNCDSQVCVKETFCLLATFVYMPKDKHDLFPRVSCYEPVYRKSISSSFNFKDALIKLKIKFGTMLKTYFSAFFTLLTPCKFSFLSAKNGKVGLFKCFKLFITILKHSKLFLKDRHQISCSRCQYWNTQRHWLLVKTSHMTYNIQSNFSYDICSRFWAPIKQKML